MRRVTAALALPLFLILGGCDDRLIPPEPPPRVESLTLSPSSLATETGLQASIEADVRTSTGETVEILWASSDTTVATVNRTGPEGRVTGESPGSAFITATALGREQRSDSVEVTVVHPVP